MKTIDNISDACLFDNDMAFYLEDDEIETKAIIDRPVKSEVYNKGLHKFILIDISKGKDPLKDSIIQKRLHDRLMYG